LRGQSQLTPSRFLHNRIYVTRMPATLSVFRDRCWQVAASNRQAEVAQKTLDFLLKEREQQRQIDVSAVRGWRDGYRMGAVFERKKESSDKGSELWVTG